MRDTFVKELLKQADQNKNVMLITGDLGFGIFDEFQERFPSQFLNVGVSEQNMIMVAAGLALEGKKIYVYSISNFPTMRCLEQIRIDICYHDLDVKIIGGGGGFSYGQLGMSHHATEDISIMRAIPNMNIIVPSCKHEVQGAMNAFSTYSSPCYLRLDKSEITLDVSPDDYKLGVASLLREGDDVTLLGCGGILDEVLKAANLLELSGVDCRVISMHTVKPIDKSLLKLCAETTVGIVTVEENNILGGLGGAVAEVCLENSIKPKFFKRIGLDDVYSSVVGDQKFLRDHYQISANYIAQVVKELYAAT